MLQSCIARPVEARHFTHNVRGYMNVKITVDVDSGQTGAQQAVEVSQTALNAVLFDFNPSADNRVVRIKALHGALITEMEAVRAAGTPAQARCASIAITELEGTQMRAVKALFAK